MFLLKTHTSEKGAEALSGVQWKGIIMPNSDRHVSSGMLGVRLPLPKIEEIKRRCAKGKLSINQWLTRAIDNQLRKR